MVNIVPVVFCFDDNFRVPSWVAVKSLIDNAFNETFYDIYIVYSRLNEINREAFASLKNKRCNINFIEIDNSRFDNMPKSEAWPYEVYYRLIIPELLPQYDKVIYSDVDVMFKGDLSALYQEDISEYQCAAVPAERKDEINGIHQHFEEYTNAFIYMSGFIIMNTKRMREEKTVAKFFENMKKYEKRLKMFDLEVFNLSCDKIKPVGFDYCVLENTYYGDYKNAPEYRFLKNVFNDEELAKAKEFPKIVHYAGGKVKMWKKTSPDPEYKKYILSAPFAEEYLKRIRLKKAIRLLNLLWWLLSKVSPVKKQRKKFKNILRGNY